MKKTITLVLASLLFCTVNAQLKLIDPTHPGADLNNTEIVVNGTPADTELEIALSVINTSTQNYTIACRRTEVDVLPNTRNSTCWVICPPYVNQGEYPTLVVGQQNGTVLTANAAPNDTLVGFLAHYDPQNIDGCSLLLYEWYDVNNPSVTLAKIYGRFTHNVNTSCTASLIEKETVSLNVFPNPVNNNLTIEIEGGNNYTLQMVDLLGKTVLSKTNLTAINTVDVSLLKDGVYFATIVKNNVIISTKKVIVKH